MFDLSDKTFSKTPNGIATDVGMPIDEGTFPLRKAVFRDLAPTCEDQFHIMYMQL